MAASRVEPWLMTSEPRPRALGRLWWRMIVRMPPWARRSLPLRARSFQNERRS